MPKAKKSLGQHFLNDMDVVKRICDLTKIENEIILEIGPGTGVLTREIKKRKPKKLFLLEKDNILSSKLESEFKNDKDVVVFNDDALKIKINEILIKNDIINEKIIIISNLPYNIGTKLILNWMYELRYIKEMILMLQDEVVDRLSAKPRTKSYSGLTVMIQSLCDVKKEFCIDPLCFDPSPVVNSAMVHIVPKGNIVSMEKYKKLDIFCRTFFQNRRKTITSVARKKNININFEIDKNKRIEEISVEEILDLINFI